MRLSSIFTFFIGLFFQQLSFAAACPASSGSITAGNGNCTVTGSQSTLQLNFNSGFDDTTVIAAVGGNGGTTVGAQRKLSFIKAAEILAGQVASGQTIIVDAAFSLLSCNAGSATLGSAGATTNTGNVSPMPGAAVSNTFYPIGLINAMGNVDYQGGASDINSSFNSNIGNVNCLQASNGWYYGFDAPPSNYIGFTTVLLHEMTHGLGFASLVNASTGAKPSGLDDIFSNELYSKLNSANWSVAGGLSNAQRAASAISGDGLLWNGSNVNTQAVGLLTAGFHDADSSSSFTSGDRAQMYAPNPVISGSSVSHFDTAASPNEIMEPQYTAGQLDLGLALYLLKDIGWTVSPAVAANNAPTITAVNQSTNEDVTKVVDASGWGNDTDGDTLTYSVSSACATNITCSINTNGTGLTMIPAANHNGGSHTITLNVSDGKGGSANDTFNLTVVAQNDAPVILGVPNQTIQIGTHKDINLSTYASDVDGDGLTYSTTACGANLTCSFPSATTLRVAAGGSSASTVSVTVKVDDGNGGINTDVFDVNITAVVVVNNAPTISPVNQSTNEDVTKVVDASSWGADTDGDTLTYTINSACAANIICSINTNGTGLTMIPTANHHGGTHAITVNVSDGKGGSASGTFNLNVIAQNDAPIINGIPNQTVQIGSSKDINLSAYASDVDGDGLTFSTTACGANLTCSFSNATTLRIAAAGSSSSTVSVTVKVDDGHGGVSTDVFQVNITAPVPSTTIKVGDTVHNDNGSFILSDSTTQINVNNGTGNYSYSLNYNSSDVSSLITSNATGLTIGLPESGEFAGSYTLTITDKGDGDVITVTVKRPLRLNWSAKSILNGNTVQTLKIEGGAAGTVYSLVQSGNADLVFRDASKVSITSATATDNADTYNAALINLDSLTVANISSMNVTVQSSYDDVVESGVKVYPSSQHLFNVKNSSGSVLKNATAELNGSEALLTELKLLTSYSTDNNGTFTVLLPSTSALAVDSSFKMTVSAEGYTPKNLVLNSDLVSHDVELVEIVNGITLKGDVNSKGGQNLVQSPPVITLKYGDDSTEVMALSDITPSKVSFNHEVDLNVKSLKLLTITQANSVTIELDISNTTQSRRFDVFLSENVSTVVSQPINTDKGATKVGSLIWLNIFIFGFLFMRGLVLKKNKLKRVL